MTNAELIINAMKEAGKAIAAGEIATRTGLDRKIVDKEMKKLKESGQIESPVRCYWQPKS